MTVAGGESAGADSLALGMTTEAAGENSLPYGLEVNMSRMGQLGAVGLALESTWAQPAAASAYLEVTHADIKPVIGYEVMNTVRGTRARRRVRAGAMLCSGPVSFDVCAGAMGEALKASLGTVTTTLVASAGGNAVYQHTFTRCDTTVQPSLTVEQNMGGLSSRQVAGVRVNQLSLALAPGRSLMADLDCRGREQTLVAPTTPTYTPEQPLHHSGFTATADGQPLEVEELLVRFNNGLVDDIWTAGAAGKLGKLPAGAFSVGGRFTMACESTAAHEAFVNGTPTNLNLKVAGASVVGTWGYGIEITLPHVRYFSANVPLAPGRLVYDIAFEALLDTSQQPALDARCRLWNAKAAY